MQAYLTKLALASYLSHLLLTCLNMFIINCKRICPVSDPNSFSDAEMYEKQQLNLPPALLMIVYWMKYLRWFSSWNSWNANLLPVQLCSHFPTQTVAVTVSLLSFLVLKKIIFVCRIVVLPRSDKADTLGSLIIWHQFKRSFLVYELNI